MMRAAAIPSIALTLVLLAAIPTASAQEDGCTQAQPCPWTLYVDEDGFYLNEPHYNGTIGDWIQVLVANDDLDATHKITLEDYDLEWTVEPIESAESEPFQLVIQGESLVTDEPSGDTTVLRVSEGDPLVEEEQAETENTDTGPDRRIPAPGFMLSVTLVGTAAVVRRRLH